MQIDAQIYIDQKPYAEFPMKFLKHDFVSYLKKEHY